MIKPVDFQVFVSFEVVQLVWIRFFQIPLSLYVDAHNDFWLYPRPAKDLFTFCTIITHVFKF